MTQWKKTMKRDMKVDRMMPECFALLSRMEFGQILNNNNIRICDEPMLFSKLLRGVQVKISNAFSTNNTTDKRRQLYSAIANIMVMLSAIEGQWWKEVE